MGFLLSTGALKMKHYERGEHRKSPSLTVVVLVGVHFEDLALSRKTKEVGDGQGDLKNGSAVVYA